MPKGIFAKEYEDYLITGNEEALNSLASGSIEKEYFFIMKKLMNEDLTTKLQNEIDAFLRKIPKEKSYRLQAINIFKKLQKNPEKKTEIIQDIKSLFNLQNVTSYSKPVKYNKASNNQKDENEAQKLPNSFKIENYIKTNKFIEDIYSGSIIPNDTEYKKVFGNNYVNLTFDFNKIPEKTLIKIFTNQKEHRQIFNSICKSIQYSKIDYFKKIAKGIATECSKKEETKKKFRKLINDFISLLLNEQINALLEYKNVFNCDRLISEFINRKYSEISEDKKERVKTLKEIKKLLNELNYKDDKMTRNVLITILDLNSRMNIFELDTFLEYIQVPLHDNPSFYNITKVLRNKIETNQRQNECFYCQIIQPNNIEDKNIIEKYLKYFF